MLYVIIIMFQMMTVFYWSNIKVNYFIDELYSIGYANRLYTEDGGGYITMDPDFAFDKWMSNSDLRQHLIMTEDQMFSRVPLLLVARKFVNGKNYYTLLNIAESAFGNGAISPRAGIVLNMVFLFFADLLLISLMKKMKMDRWIGFCGFVMFAFCGYVISAALYVRFYMLLIFLLLVLLNCIYRIWNAGKWWQMISPGIISAIVLYMSFKNSELTVPFAVAFFFSYIIALIAEKKWKQLIACATVCAVGTYYLIIETGFVDVILHPQEHRASRIVFAQASASIREISVGSLGHYFNWLRRLLETHYFGNGLATCLFLGISVCCLAVIYIKRNKEIDAAVRKKYVLSLDSAYVYVLVGTVLIYTCIQAVLQYDVWRYYCYGFVLLSVIIWYTADRVLKNPSMEQYKKTVTGVLVGFVVINALLPFWTRNIEYMYEGERDFVNKIQNNDDRDVIMLLPVDEETILIEEKGYLSRHALYDCVNMMSESAQIYIASMEGAVYRRIDYPDAFLLWTREDEDMTDVLDYLEESGYNVREIGYDHESRTYDVKKRIRWEI